MKAHKQNPEFDDLRSLVEAAREGDRVAFGALIEATQYRLFRFTLTLCGDRVLAEDLCQEAYVKVFQNFKHLESRDAFLDWLFQITKNLFLDIKKSKASQTSPLEAEEFEALAAESRDMAEIVAIHKALSQFEPEDRWLLLLVDLEERSYKEAADAMNVSEDTVRSRLFRLRKLFIEKMSKE